MKGLTPRIISLMKDYNRETFMKDLMAGIIVGIVALPLAIAFGIASGVTPEKGITFRGAGHSICHLFCLLYSQVTQG